MGKLATFDDWTGLFRKWQKDIGFERSSQLNPEGEGAIDV